MGLVFSGVSKAAVNPKISNPEIHNKNLKVKSIFIFEVEVKALFVLMEQACDNK